MERNLLQRICGGTMLMMARVWLALLAVTATAACEAATEAPVDRQPSALSTGVDVPPASDVAGEPMTPRALSIVGGAWHEIVAKKPISACPSVWPSASQGHVASTDPTSGRVVLFGGQLDPDGATWIFGECNAQKADRWNRIDTTLHPPIGLIGAAFAYYAEENVAVLFGGVSEGVVRDDMWIWDENRTWTQVNIPRPPARHGHAMGYDDSDHPKIVLLGGCAVPYGINQACSSPFPNEGEWVLTKNGSTWSWTNQPALVDPKETALFLSRWGAGMVYDSEERRLLMAGGRTTIGQGNSFPVWGRHTDESTWKKLTGVSIPTGSLSDPPELQGLARNLSTLRTVLVVQNQTQEWTSAGFEQVPLKDSAPGVTGSAMAYDQSMKQMVLYGGETNSVWVYQTWGNACSDDADCDCLGSDPTQPCLESQGRCVDGVCCQAKSCDVCQACSPTSAVCEPVSGDDDSCAPGTTCDLHGVCRNVTGTACLKDDECLEGLCVDKLCVARCASDADCGPETFCDSESEQCISVCNVDTGEIHGSSTPCAPFSCQGATCRTSCAGGDDCAAGYDCKDSKCVARDLTTEEPKCDCRAAGRRTSDVGFWAGGLLLLAAWRRRSGREC